MISYRNREGFTLVELGVVAAIIGFVAAIALPNLISWLPEMRLKRAARDLYSNMVTVRMNAVKENTPWAIVFDTANNRYFLCDDWGADGTWTGAGDATGAGDNNILATYCMDGSSVTGAVGELNCTQRKSGVVLGSGDATVRASTTLPVAAPTAIPADDVSYTTNHLVFNAQATGSAGYVYLQHQGATSSFAVGTLASGVVHVLKSAEGVTGYVQ